MKTENPPCSTDLNSCPELIKEIENHPYYRSLIEIALVPIMKTWKEARAAQQEFSPSPVQQYHIDVFYRSAALFETIKRLNDISYFMMNNPSFKSMDIQGVTPEDWFIYHYSNYRVVALGIYDMALIVVNFLLRIDLPPKECSIKTIRKHPLVREKKLDLPLIGLEKILEPYREERNLYVHRGERPDVEFVDQLKGYRFLKVAKDKGIYQGQLPSRTIANAWFFEQRNAKAKELRSETLTIASIVIKLLDVWHPIYLDSVDDFLNAN